LAQNTQEDPDEAFHDFTLAAGIGMRSAMRGALFVTRSRAPNTPGGFASRLLRRVPVALPTTTPEGESTRIT
jgi:hypothetical protein